MIYTGIALIISDCPLSFRSVLESAVSYFSSSPASKRFPPMAIWQDLILLFLVLHLNQITAGSKIISDAYDSFQVFLVNGSSHSEGRVEVLLQGKRRTVCDVGWSLNNARVICRMLGFDGALAAPGDATFGQGSGEIIGDCYDCLGTEYHILDCPSLMTVDGNCTHSQDAGAICYSEAPFQVHLVGGASSNEGRVELEYDGISGTICDDAWSLQDAKVVCNMRNFDGALAAPRNATFGPGSGDIFLDEVTCDGSEDSLAECSHRGVGVHDCDHHEDAGVKCFSGDPFEVHLIGGSDAAEGRVEISYGGSRGTVCDNNWDMKDAKVICRRLGFDGALAAPRAAAYGQGSGEIFLDNVGCDGTEEKIADCFHLGVGVHDCEHANDAGVRCFSGTDPFKVRLVGGEDDARGRVEVLFDGAWGTVCDDDWDPRDAKVVCRMLGFDGALEAPRSARFGKGEGDSILDGLRCRGTEDHLADCMHGGFGSHKCGHEKDASAICISYVRLVGGSSNAEGRVEIQHQGKWGTVCHDGWDIADATVVCRMLGFSNALEAPGSAHFGKGSDDIFLDEVQCEGTETRLTDCKHDGIGEHNCAHTEDAGVVCDNKDDMIVGKVVGAVVGGIFMLLIGFGMLALLVYCRRKKREGRDLESPSASEGSEISGPSKVLEQLKGIPMTPPKLPFRASTLPISLLTKKQKADDTKTVCSAKYPDEGDGGVVEDDDGKHLYMAMGSEYDTPSTVKNDASVLQFVESDDPVDVPAEVPMDVPGDVPAVAEEDVYMGNELTEAGNPPVIGQDDSSLCDVKL